MYADIFPPAVLKSPPTYKSLPDIVSACTLPFTPDPRAAQLLPFHLAIELAGMSPAVVKEPPAYRSLPETASADTREFIPEPSVDQPVPFHLATIPRSSLAYNSFADT